MSKQQIIEQIRELNRSVPQEFLVAFKEQALEEYLQRLTLSGGRGRRSVWVRRNDHPAVATRLHAGLVRWAK